MTVVDRIEERIAVLISDDGTRREIPVSLLPEGAGEGSVLTQTAEGFALDEPATAQRRQSTARRMKSLFKKK